MKSHFRVLALIAFIAGCSEAPQSNTERSQDNLVKEGENSQGGKAKSDPLKEKYVMDSAIREREVEYLEKAPLDIDIVSKHNLRSAEKDGWKVDVWSDGRLVLSFSFGVRVFKKDSTTPPETTIILALRRLDGIGSPVRIKFRPELRETAIPGGYSEVIMREDGTSVESKEKFKGSPGVWERIIKYPVTREDLKGFMEGDTISNTYVLDTTVSLKDGPTLELRGLRFQYATRLK